MRPPLCRQVRLDAAVTMPMSPHRVFDFLADPLNQCWIAEGCAEVVERPARSHPPTGARIALRSPIPIGPQGALRLLGSSRPNGLLMLIDGAHGAQVFLFWEIVPSRSQTGRGEASVVRLRAAI